MKRIQAVIVSAILLVGFHVSAQDARRTITAVTAVNSRVAANAIIAESTLDLTKRAFVAEEFAYKKWGTVTANVCNAGVIKTGKGKHSTLFLNLGATANCDAYKTPTVFSAINVMADADAFAASLIGKTMQFKEVFFKRDKDRERYVAFVAIDQKGDRVSVVQGRNSIAIPNFHAGLVRTDTPVEKTVGSTSVEGKDGVGGSKAVEATTVEGKSMTSGTSRPEATSSNNRSTGPSSKAKVENNSIFSRFFKLFNF